MIQHTAHNKGIPLDIINTFNKRRTRNRFQLENPIKVDYMYIGWQRDLPYQQNDQGIVYKNSQHSK